jgi:WD40 repeat protein
VPHLVFCFFLCRAVSDTGEVTLSRPVLQGAAPVNLAAFSPDGRCLLVGALDGRLRVYDLPACSLRLECAVAGPAEGAIAAAWMPDSRQFLAATPDRQLSLHDVSLGGGVVRRIKLPSHVHDAVVSRDGGTVVTVGQDRRLRYFRLEDRREAFVGPEPTAVTCLAASPDGRFLAATMNTGAVRLWPLGDLRPPAAAAPRPGAGDPLDALPAAPLQELRPEDATVGRFVLRSAMGGAGCAFVACGSEEGRVFVWHRETGELLASLAGHSGVVNAVAWNPRNQYMMASAGDDRSVRIWTAPVAARG